MQNGKQIVTTMNIAGSCFRDVNLSGAGFEDVNLSGAEFSDVNLSSARFHNVNLSDISVTAAQIGGAMFKHIGLPDGSPGNQRPLRFQECDLKGTTFEHCDLTGAAINECNISGLRINDVSVEELFKAYESQQRSS